jgi:glutathione peroxidase-family protein
MDGRVLYRELAEKHGVTIHFVYLSLKNKRNSKRARRIRADYQKMAVDRARQVLQRYAA